MCEFCEKSIILNNTDEYNENLTLHYARIDKIYEVGLQVIDSEMDKIIFTEINYCPMCGRKLS